MPDYELCVIGAGIAGLNAVAVAGSYLGRRDRVLLVDGRDRVGGMWNDTYDYVRLHQPHGNFTAGAIPWALDRPPEHLATKTEVLGHLDHCADVAGRSVDLHRRLGRTYTGHRPVPGGVEIDLCGPDGVVERVRAARLVKAFGHRLTSARPLELSSRAVRSVTPEGLDADAHGSEGPVWIIGGGKTAMDVAYHLLRMQPAREVNLVAGNGVFFGRRETFFPTGSRSWWTGTPLNSVLRKVAGRFDGTNEDEVATWLRDTYCVTPVPDARDFFSAYLSDEECSTIAAGLTTVEADYLDDVRDTDAGPELVLRSGRTRPIPGGSVIVNCTGSLLRDTHPYEPVVSDGGRTVSIQMRSCPTGPFTPFAGYYLTHLLFLGRLSNIGLYELDLEALAAKDRRVVIYAAIALAMHNLGCIATAVPPKVMLGCGLDYDRWYPLPRRLVGMVDFMAHVRAERRHNQATLDRIAARFGVRCMPLRQDSEQVPVTVG
jgi:hypothetical protein